MLFCQPILPEIFRDLSESSGIFRDFSGSFGIFRVLSGSPEIPRDPARSREIPAPVARVLDLDHLYLDHLSPFPIFFDF